MDPIPARLVRFIEQHANLAFAGTRDAALVPHGHRISGWRVGADGRSLTAMVAAGFTPHLVESLEDNGEFALTVEEFPSHETYQFKGRFRGHRLIDAADLEAVDRIRARFVTNVKPLYPDAPAPLIEAYILPPVIAIEFEVREIFVQTPGPGAGKRIAPQEER